MSVLDDLGTPLASVASSSGANGYFLSRGMMPDSSVATDRMVALIEMGGSARILGPNLTDATVQVLVRGPQMTQVSSAYRDAQAVAQQAKHALHGFTATTVNGRYYVAIQAQQEPYSIGEDEVQRPLFSATYRVLVSAATS